MTEVWGGSEQGKIPNREIKRGKSQINLAGACEMGCEIWIYRGKKQLIGVNCTYLKNRAVDGSWAGWSFGGFGFWQLQIWPVDTYFDTSGRIFIWVFYGNFSDFQIIIRKRSWILGRDNSLPIFRKIQGRRVIIQVIQPYVYMSSF